MEKNSALIIRVDAHTSIGAGHVMRCIAMAQQFKKKGNSVHFVMAMDAGLLFDRIELEDIILHRINEHPSSQADLEKTVSIAKKVCAEWIVMDGYQFNTQFQQGIKAHGFKLLVVDDNGEHDHYFADVILNQNIYGSKTLYPSQKIEDYSRLFIGVSFCMLRKEFWAYDQYSRSQGTANILVTLGGSDTENVTVKVLSGLADLEPENFKIRVVAGANNPHLAELNDYIDNKSKNTVLFENVDNMPEMMAWADIAVSAAGSTCYELNYMKVPFVCIVTAKNQVEFARQIWKLGGRSLGWCSSATPGDIRQAVDETLKGELKVTQVVQMNSKVFNEMMK